MIRGLKELHNKKIAHRDIRPQNIYYVGGKHGYVIGGLENSIIVENNSNKIGYNLNGVPYYLP